MRGAADQDREFPLVVDRVNQSGCTIGADGPFTEPG